MLSQRSSLLLFAALTLTAASAVQAAHWQHSSSSHPAVTSSPGMFWRKLLQANGTNATAGSNSTAASTANATNNTNTTAAAPVSTLGNSTDANKTAAAAAAAAAEVNATANSNTTKAAQPSGPVSGETKVWTPRPDGSVIGVTNTSGITSSNETDLAWDLRADVAKYKMEMVTKHKGSVVKEVRKDFPASANKTQACLPCINVCKETGLWMDADWCLDLLNKKDAATSYCKCYQIVQEAKKSAASVGVPLGFAPMVLLVAVVQVLANSIA